ncbi:MAG TPA: DNA polymerase Y family protein [Candidatus Binataceae bacterium]
MGRIACMLVSDFPIAALIRSNPDLAAVSLAISETSAAHAELLFVSPRARAAGIRSGMTIAQGRAVSSGLVTATRSRAAEISAADALSDAAESVSPVIEAGDPGCVWLDIGGLEKIFSSEEEIAAELNTRVNRVGMEASAAIASNREIALMAARCGGSRIIRSEKQREFIDWLPLDVLGLGVQNGGGIDLERTLARWGLKRLGDIARLDPDTLGSRLGRIGVELTRLARGGDSRPLAPRPRSEIYAEAIDLEYGIETLEPLGFVMRPMLERLTERLAMRGLVAGDITLTLGLSGHRVNSRRAAMAAASNEVRTIMTLLNLNLEAAPPQAAIESIRIEVEPRSPRPAQTDLFLPPSPAPDKLQATLARLASLCGPGNVGAPRTENSHRPEAIRIERFDPPPPSPAPNETHAKDFARLALRAIRPALEIEVMCSRGAPEFVRGPNLGARVVSIAGPWRRDGEWWRHEPPETSRSEELCETGRRCFASSGFAATARAAVRSFAPEACAQDDGPRPMEIFFRHPERSEGSRTLPRAMDERSAEDARMNSRLPKRTSGFIRDYFELALEDGGVYRIFHDLISRRWFLDGAYD